MTDRIIIDGLTEDEQAVFDRLWAHLQSKTPRNVLRSCYYDGKRALHQVGSVIPPQYYRLGIVLGWSAKAVDTLARRCNLDGFVWPDGKLLDIGGAEVWQDNHLGTEVSNGLVSSLIHGTSFLINTRGDTDEGEPKSLIHAKDGLNATGTWNARTRGLDDLLSINARDEDGDPTSFALYLPDLTIVAERDGKKWEVDHQEHALGVPADPLVYKARTGRPYGMSRISRPVMSLHDQALRTVIRLEGHMDVYSFPEMWLLGADSSVFKNADGTPKAAWQVMLGRIKAIPDDEDAANPRAQVEQFRASDPDAHLKALRQQAQLFAGETSIPLTSLGVSDMSNPTSADSYIASREDLIAEAEGATDDWAPALRRTLQRALAIQNDLTEIPPQWRSIDAKWRSPVYLSKAAAADAGSKQLAAIPWLADTEVGLELLGLDEQQIIRALAEKRRQGGSAALKALVDAAQAGQQVVSGAGIGSSVQG